MNPLTKTIEVFRRAQAGWVLLSTHGGGESVRAEPFEAIAIGLPELWGGDGEQAPFPITLVRDPLRPPDLR